VNLVKATIIGWRPNCSGANCVRAVYCTKEAVALTIFRRDAVAT